MKLKFPVFSKSVTYALGRNKDLDFYYRNGQAIIATKGKKSKKTPKKVSPAQRKTHEAFRYCRDWSYHLGENCVFAYKRMAEGTTKTWRDIFFSQALHNLWKTAWYSSQVFEFRFYGDENQLYITWWSPLKAKDGVAEIPHFGPIKHITARRGKYEICDYFPFHLPYVIGFELATEINIGAQKTNIKPWGYFIKNAVGERLGLSPLTYAEDYYRWFYAAEKQWNANKHRNITSDPFCYHSETVTYDYNYSYTIRDMLCGFTIDIPLDLIAKIKSIYISKSEDNYSIDTPDTAMNVRWKQGTNLIIGGNVFSMGVQEHEIRIPRRPWATGIPLYFTVYIVPWSYKNFMGAARGIPSRNSTATWRWRPARYSIDLKFYRYVRKKAGITKPQMDKLMAIVQRIPGMEGYLMISPLFRPSWYRAQWRPLSMLEKDDFDPVKEWPRVPWPEFPKTPEEADNAADTIDDAEKVDVEDPEFWYYENY